MKARFPEGIFAVWPQLYRPRAELKSYYTFQNYLPILLITILVISLASLVPLSIVTFVHQELVKKAVESERVLRTERIASNAKRSVTYFLQERIDALEFAVREVSFKKIQDPHQLATVLKNLKIGFGGLSDLGVIDHKGNQVAYVGPFALGGKNYSDQAWFLDCANKGHFVSEVFQGFRAVPHIIIAVKSTLADGSFYILRATLDTDRLIRAVNSFNPDENADIFLINRSGTIQTPSFYYGKVLQQAGVPTPTYTAHTSSLNTVDNQGNPIILGYAFISTSLGETPFVLMVVNRKAEMLKLLRTSLGRNVTYFFIISVVVVLVIVILTSTFLVNKIYESDSAKAETMQKIEQTSHLASIGRLAAGVAHEINNPLAVINEEAGYIRDLLSLKEQNREDTEFIEHIDSILESVERCGVITKNLLSFSRQFDLKTQSIKLDKLINDVLSFHRKEAEYRNVTIDVDVPEQTPVITTDTGKLQQILINLVNNAFQAVEDGGRLEISVSQNKPKEVAIAVSDNGIGISEENLKKVFEPFFTTKHDGGTGLGLAITYGLVRKLQGKISVGSSPGKGTTFTVTLPVNVEEGSKDEGPTGR